MEKTGFINKVGDVVEDVAGAIANAIEKAANVLRGIKKEVDKSKADLEERKKVHLTELKGILGSVEEIREGISVATRDTHIGAIQCCDKLDRTIEVIKNAIQDLEDQEKNE